MADCKHLRKALRRQIGLTNHLRPARSRKCGCIGRLIVIERMGKRHQHGSRPDDGDFLKR